MENDSGRRLGHFPCSTCHLTCHSNVGHYLGNDTRLCVTDSPTDVADARTITNVPDDNTHNQCPCQSEAEVIKNVQQDVKRHLPSVID